MMKSTGHTSDGRIQKPDTCADLSYWCVAVSSNGVSKTSPVCIPVLTRPAHLWMTGSDKPSSMHEEQLEENRTMGRTARTFRDALDIEEERWKDFRRTLRPSKRELMDRIFEYARMSGDAGSMIVTPRVTEVVLLSAMLELLREIEELQRRIGVLEGTTKENAQDDGARVALGCEHRP
ncbi:MAG: hypothetical protein HXY34_12015 [Candidatus Thorarchaeota archaeon]|nr:hypothetical protein [Candidatus Thorarchaeota archaeon]